MLLIIFKVHIKHKDLMLATLGVKAMISKPLFFLFRVKAVKYGYFHIQQNHWLGIEKNSVSCLVD